MLQDLTGLPAKNLRLRCFCLCPFRNPPQSVSVSQLCFVICLQGHKLNQIRKMSLIKCILSEVVPWSPCSCRSKVPSRNGYSLGERSLRICFWLILPSSETLVENLVLAVSCETLLLQWESHRTFLYHRQFLSPLYSV